MRKCSAHMFLSLIVCVFYFAHQSNEDRYAASIWAFLSILFSLLPPLKSFCLSFFVWLMVNYLIKELPQPWDNQPDLAHHFQTNTYSIFLNAASCSFQIVGQECCENPVDLCFWLTTTGDHHSKIPFHPKAFSRWHSKSGMAIMRLQNPHAKYTHTVSVGIMC